MGAGGDAAGLLQAANTGDAPECLVKGKDLTGSRLEGNLADQVIGEPDRAADLQGSERMNAENNLPLSIDWRWLSLDFAVFDAKSPLLASF